jgi:uncharacterized protein
VTRLSDSRTALRDLARSGYFDRGELPSTAARLSQSFDRMRSIYSHALSQTADKRDSVNVVIKPAGDACNLRCSYCPTCGNDVGRFPSAESFGSMISKALTNDYALVDFTIHGGEPLLVGPDRMRDYLESIRQARLTSGKAGNVFVQTNGVLLDEKWANLFLEYGVHVGVSLDGSERINDRHRLDSRGRGTYKRVISGINAAAGEGLPVGVLCVAPDEPDLWEDFEVFIRSARFSSVDLEIKFSVLGSAHEISYGENLGRLFRDWLLGLLPGQFSPKLFESILDQIAFDGGSLCWIAGTCHKHVGVNQRGDVTPCCDRLTGSSKFMLGSLSEVSLAELRSGPTATKFFATARDVHRDCVSCDFLPVCNGGCVFYRIASTGHPSGKDPMCGTYKRFFARALEAVNEAVTSRGAA